VTWTDSRELDRFQVHWIIYCLFLVQTTVINIIKSFHDWIAWCIWNILWFVPNTRHLSIDKTRACLLYLVELPPDTRLLCLTSFISWPTDLMGSHIYKKHGYISKSSCLNLTTDPSHWGPISIIFISTWGTYSLPYELYIFHILITIRARMAILLQAIWY
jgi:hypothetical protein